MRRILIAGESWITHSIHQRGVDCFTSSSYHEGVGPLRTALEAGGFEVDYLPNHLAAAQFPSDLDGLRRYRVVMLSDIGANTLLLHPDTSERSVPTANRLALLRDYVRSGGGLVMIGGYLTFQGMDGRARYAGTPVERLPEPIPRHVVKGSVAVGNKANGFYANHHTAGIEWHHNTAYRNHVNFNLRGRERSDNRTVIPGRGHRLKNNLGFRGGVEVAELNADACDVAGNYFTLPVTITADDFASLDESELTRPRQAKRPRRSRCAAP